MADHHAIRLFINQNIKNNIYDVKKLENHFFKIWNEKQ